MCHPSYAPPKPPVSGSDLAISIVALILTVLLGVVASVFGLFLLAFLDHCPPESCSVDGAVTAVGTALLVAFVIGVVGLIATVIQLVRRKRGWPFAVGTLVLCGIAVFVGGVGYSMAVGA
jgi:quinol-cytochrome oxidoreductase complex cytochrome b subunit